MRHLHRKQIPTLTPPPVKKLICWQFKKLKKKLGAIVLKFECLRLTESDLDLLPMTLEVIEKICREQKDNVRGF